MDKVLASEDTLEARGEDLNAYARKLELVDIQRHMVSWQGAQLSLLQTGPKTGSQVLLLHGVTYSSASVFHLDVPGKASDEYSLILKLGLQLGCWALDFAGYGFSDTHHKQKDENIEDYVEQVKQAVEYIQECTNAKPIVIGWSWGGQVASRYAGTYGDTISGLVFWGALWGGTGQQAEFVKSLSLPEFHRRINTTLHAGADFKTPDTFDLSIKEAFVERALKQDPTSPTTGVRETAYNLPLHSPAAITIPTLVLHGEHDFVTQSDDVAHYFEALSSVNKQYMIIGNADHNAQFSFAREELINALVSFSMECSLR